MATEKQKEELGIALVNSLKDKLGKTDLAGSKSEWQDGKGPINTKHTHGRHDSGLIGSIDYHIEGDEVVITMVDYAEYVEFGTPNPTTPDEILKWVKDKIKVKGKNKSKTEENIAKNLAKHITKYGTKPFPFIRTTIANDLPKITKDILG